MTSFPRIGHMIFDLKFFCNKWMNKFVHLIDVSEAHPPPYLKKKSVSLNFSVFFFFSLLAKSPGKK